jgi:hypothetical protein
MSKLDLEILDLADDVIPASDGEEIIITAGGSIVMFVNHNDGIIVTVSLKLDYCSSPRCDGLTDCKHRQMARVISDRWMIAQAMQRRRVA